MIRYALPNQQANASQTYVGLADDAVIGFYTLAVGEVRYDDAPERLTKGLARHSVLPITLLARLGVSIDWQGKGVGAGLLRDAVLRTLQAADIAGIRAIVVHAKDERARNFYRRFDFAESPSDSLHLFALIKNLERL
ncbi:GNAT family N-acetyltransferase [Nitrobacter sp.]|uniref:GNAT family N-acetyltransferase n=1 Tax=unclassified Nitrobacter TaxID=2620411 RepID=UPI00321F87F4